MAVQSYLSVAGQSSMTELVGGIDRRSDLVMGPTEESP